MTNQDVQQKPSETAMFAALRRAIANKEFANEIFGPDFLAENFLPPHFRFFLRFRKIQEDTKNKLNGFLPGLNEYMIARTAYFDSLFVDALYNKYSQIVLLGAGYDTRAYRFSELNQGTKIFELDAAPTQNRKKKCLKKARINIPEYVTFVPINFNTELINDALERTEYENRERTLFIWEGVSYYLEAESVDATLEYINQSSSIESVIAFDYAVSVSEGNLDKYYGAREFAQTMKEHHANEELMFSIEEGKVESFLEQRDLNVVDHLNTEEIERAYLVDDDGSLIGHITGHFRFVLASK